ncbi:hypothetical protein HK101_010806, partial [Irineochytrium annulatum]
MRDFPVVGDNAADRAREYAQCDYPVSEYHAYPPPPRPSQPRRPSPSHSAAPDYFRYAPYGPASATSQHRRVNEWDERMYGPPMDGAYYLYRTHVTDDEAAAHNSSHPHEPASPFQGHHPLQSVTHPSRTVSGASSTYSPSFPAQQPDATAAVPSYRHHNHSTVTIPPRPACFPAAPSFPLSVTHSNIHDNDATQQHAIATDARMRTAAVANRAGSLDAVRVVTPTSTSLRSSTLSASEAVAAASAAAVQHLTTPPLLSASALPAASTAGAAIPDPVAAAAAIAAA